MKNDDRLDLSALDPSADAARWEHMVSRVVARGMAARQAAESRTSVADLLARWRRPALALAAVLALVAVPVLLFVPADATTGQPTTPNAALAVVGWAWEGQAQPMDLLDAVVR